MKNYPWAVRFLDTDGTTVSVEYKNYNIAEENASNNVWPQGEFHAAKILQWTEDGWEVEHQIGPSSY